MYLRPDTPVAHFSHQGTNKWKGRFCKSFQSKGIRLGFLFICSVMGLCNSFGMRATVSRFQILTSLLFLGMFFMLRIRTAKHSLVLSYLVKETEIFNLSDWPDVFTKNVATNTRQYTLQRTNFYIYLKLNCTLPR